MTRLIKKRPLLTVVIPVYNVALYLDACLESVLSQDFSKDEIEVIMINDGSTDGSEAIAIKWADKHTNFKLINQPNQGLSAARNSGITKASGKYMVFLDSDDIVPPRAYRDMVNILEESGSDFITGAVYRFKTHSNKPWIWARVEDLYTRDRRNLTIKDNPEYIRDGLPTTKIYRRQFFLDSKILFPIGRTYEDIATTPKLYYLARSFDVYSSPAYYWRFNSQGISLGVNIQKIRDRLWGLEQSEQFLRLNNAPQKLLDEYDYFTLDYNLRRILLDAWKYKYEERREIIDSCCKVIKNLNPTAIERVPEPLYTIAKLAFNNEQQKLLEILVSPLNESKQNTESTPIVREVYLKARIYAGKIKRKLRKSLSTLKSLAIKSLIYFILRPIIFILPLQQHTAVFSNYWGERFNTSSGPAAICIKLSQLDPTFKCVVFAHKNSFDSIQSNVVSLTGENSNIKVVINNTLGYYYYLWSAKYLFNDVNFQTGINIKGKYRLVGKRKGQIETETTHGIPLKKMGLDSNQAINPKSLSHFLSKNRRYDYLVSTSPITAELFKKSHDINPKILKTGLPQHDFLFVKPTYEYIQELRDRYNIAKDKQVVVYTPTWRYTKGAGMRYLIDFNKLHKNLKGSHQVIIKAHTWNHTNLAMIDFKNLTNYSEINKTGYSFIKLHGIIRNSFDFRQKQYTPSEEKPNFKPILDDVDINELMLIADVLITDYSSTMFSYAHLDKPQIFFTPDIEHYNSTRGSYFNIDEIAPGMVAKSTDDLIKGIKLSQDKTKWKKKYSNEIKRFHKDYLEWEKGDAATKILQEVGII